MREDLGEVDINESDEFFEYSDEDSIARLEDKAEEHYSLSPVKLNIRHQNSSFSFARQESLFEMTREFR